MPNTSSNFLSSVGASLNFKIKQGSTFGPYKFIVKNPDGTFVDLSQIEIRGQLRKSPSDVNYVSFDVTKTNAVQGEFSIEISSEVTKNLQGSLSEQSLLNLYYYDIELDSGLSNVTSFLNGQIRVISEITK